MTYRPEIDGLRAIAVLAVLVYHARLGLTGGYVGVDIFFVISGYLITGLIYREFQEGRFSYKRFWGRRLRRLVPALAVATLVTAALANYVLLPNDLKDLGGSMIAQPLSLSNVYFWRVVQAGYFAEAPEIRPLLHTWSLGVEEEFYLLYPPLLVLLARPRKSKVPSAYVLLTVAALSLGLCILLIPSKAVAAFFNLPTRVWEFLIGALILYLPRPGRRHIVQLGSLLGVLMVVYPMVFYHDQTPFPGIAATVPCLGTALLIWCTLCTASPCKTVLSNPALVGLGKTSYSVYLWHWPLFAFGFYLHLLTDIWSRVLVAALSIGVGYVSWRWVEMPVRVKTGALSGLSTAPLVITYFAVTCGLGLAFWSSSGFPSSWPIESVQLMPRRDDSSRLFEIDLKDAQSSASRLGVVDKRNADFLLVGDSHAMSVSPVFDRLGRQYGVSGLQLTRSATPALTTWTRGGRDSDTIKAGWKQLIEDTLTQNEIRAIFLHCAWLTYDSEFLQSELRATIRDIRLASKNKDIEVYLVLDTPWFDSDPRRQAALAVRWPRRFRQPVLFLDEKRKALNLKLKTLVQSEGGHILDPSPTFLSHRPPYIVDGRCLYKDDHHLSDTGSYQLQPMLDPAFAKLQPVPQPWRAESQPLEGIK